MGPAGDVSVPIELVIVRAAQSTLAIAAFQLWVCVCVCLFFFCALQHLQILEAFQLQLNGQSTAWVGFTALHNSHFLSDAHRLLFAGKGSDRPVTGLSVGEWCFWFRLHGGLVAAA